MQALIIVAHGSKLKSSNDEIKNIALKIKENIEEDKLLVFYSFLELSEPSIFQSGEEAVKSGCKTIKFFPYFLAAGKHVKVDIPNEIDKLKNKFPEINFTLLPHIGACKGMEKLILGNI